MELAEDAPVTTPAESSQEPLRPLAFPPPAAAPPDFAVEPSPEPRVDLAGAAQQRAADLAPLDIAQSRVAVTAALNQAAGFLGSLDFLATRLVDGSQHRLAVDVARRSAGEVYNKLALAAGLLAVR